MLRCRDVEVKDVCNGCAYVTEWCASCWPRALSGVLVGG